MSNAKDEQGISKISLNGLTKSIPFLLAGLEDGIEGFTLTGFTLQSTSDGDFRCILRGFEPTRSGVPVRLVSFTNSGLASECLLLAEIGFRDDKARWHVDQYANGPRKNGDTKSRPRRKFKK